MGQKVTLDLDRDVYDTLTALADSLRFTREAAAEYAIRMIGACMREGLLEDVPARAWPQEANLLTAAVGRVIDFPCAKAAEAESHA